MYPMTTPSRMVLSLNGIWDFCLDTDVRMEGEWSVQRLLCPLPMPVPSSYNDLYEGRAFRNHIGEVIYQRSFSLPPMGDHQTVLLHFSSVTHAARVFVNGQELGTHKGGFLPFAFELDRAALRDENVLTVAVSTIVDDSTLPVGRLEWRQGAQGMENVLQDLANFDFFNYTGIQRPVSLLIVPKNRITDIEVSGDDQGRLSYCVKTNAEGSCKAELISPTGDVLLTLEGFTGKAKIENAALWSPASPALYGLRVTFEGASGRDVYTESFGFRTVTIRDCHICLNGDPVYLKGFGKHEDTPVNGRGLNEAYNVKDIALIKWIHANSFRTSHYPYSEEMLRLCDREGILVIDESPAVGLHTGFTAVGLLGGVPNGTWRKLRTAEHHREVIRDMLARDKNHPCVIMWSVANEPASEEEGAREYFEPLIRLVKELDSQRRSVTVVTYGGAMPETCRVAPLLDVLVLNRYYGWYDLEGDLPAAAAALKNELERYHALYPDKPIMLGEYGADCVASLHDATPTLFSEEYQADMLEVYGETLDQLPYITGEHVWNFADFMTCENIKRVQGNKKGVFTRERKPKLAAHVLRKRWENK